jgi:hypothetical protein
MKPTSKFGLLFNVLFQLEGISPNMMRLFHEGRHLTDYQTPKEVQFPILFSFFAVFSFSTSFIFQVVVALLFIWVLNLQKVLLFLKMWFQ